MSKIKNKALKWSPARLLVMLICEKMESGKNELKKKKS